MDKNNKIAVISLGGSIIVPDNVNSEFLKSFSLLIKKHVEEGYNFLIITGGGRTCRRYNEAVKNVTDPSNEDLDWLGIASTRLNAEIVRICLGELSYKMVVMNPDDLPETNKPVLVGGGWKPGNSSDLAAVCGARSLGAKKIINLSNIDYVYDKDPKLNSDAKPIPKMNWREFEDQFPKRWDPGSHTPFDPIAAQEAEELGQEVVILNGNNIENLDNYLSGKDFTGTVIR